MDTPHHAMRCAWCDAGAESDRVPVTHGICRACRERRSATTAGAADDTLASEPGDAREVEGRAEGEPADHEARRARMRSSIDATVESASATPSHQTSVAPGHDQPSVSRQIGTATST